jgi:molecular chaperone DnaK
MLAADARAAVKDQAPPDRVRELTNELQQIYHSLGASTSRPSGGGARDSGDQATSGGDDDVVDADFTVS